jgi:hypothetical protein
MDDDRTIEFLLKNQARMDERMDARFAKADLHMSRLERVLAQNNRSVTQRARHGVSLRSDVRRIDKALVQVSESLSESDAKFNALIDIVDQHLRCSGRQE